MIMEVRQCAICGKDFVAERKNAKYCGGGCVAEARRRASRRYYHENREACKARNSRWAKDHRDELRTYNRLWRRRNPEKVKGYNKRYTERNRDKIREYKRKWRENNPEKVKEYNLRRYRGNAEDIKERERKRYERVKQIGDDSLRRRAELRLDGEQTGELSNVKPAVCDFEGSCLECPRERCVDES